VAGILLTHIVYDVLNVLILVQIQYPLTTANFVSHTHLMDDTHVVVFPFVKLNKQ